MTRNRLIALVLGALGLPLVAAAVPVLAGAQLVERTVLERDERPAFDPRPGPSEQPIATTSVLWSPRSEPHTEHGRTTGWPAAVERLFAEHVEALPRPEEALAGKPELASRREPLEGMRCFRTVLPGGVELYAVEHVWVPTAYSGLSFVLRDGATGRVSARAHTLVQRWSSAGERGPNAWWADLDGEGALELGIERTYHNGTVDNGTFVRWFRVTEELGLEQVHVSPLVDEVCVESRGGRGVVRTRLLRGAGGELIHDQWFENPAYGIDPRAMGRPPTEKAAERRCDE